MSRNGQLKQCLQYIQCSDWTMKFTLKYVMTVCQGFIAINFSEWVGDGVFQDHVAIDTKPNTTDIFWWHHGTTLKC
jgi:hypothetical protein